MKVYYILETERLDFVYKLIWTIELWRLIWMVECFELKEIIKNKSNVANSSTIRLILFQTFQWFVK
jgi:hypothetical protein